MPGGCSPTGSLRWEADARDRVAVTDCTEFDVVDQANPYVSYASAERPFPDRRPLPEKLLAMARVVGVDGEAWALELVRDKRRIETDSHVIAWTAGQASALNTRKLAQGRDVGTVTVERKTGNELADAVDDVTLAFVFRAFHPDGTLACPRRQLRQGA